MKLYLRADGNSEIMTGHVARCLSIAHAVCTLGGKAIFIAADHEMEPVIAGQGFPLICLDSDWRNLAGETEKMERLIRTDTPDCLLVDSYSVTPQYLGQLRQIVRLAYMDDLDAFTYPCDVLINYNHYAHLLPYERYGSDTQFLMGTHFAPLRPEFSNLPAFRVLDDACKVLVTTGGSDPYNIAGGVVELLKKGPDASRYEIHVVAGRFNLHLEELLELQRQYNGVIIHSNVDRMSDLMCGCDMAVTAGGSTLYELCACGLPAVFFIVADNQQNAALAFSKELMEYAGDAREGTALCVERICAALAMLKEDVGLRKRRSIEMQRLVDGGGALRIAAALMGQPPPG